MNSFKQYKTCSKCCYEDERYLDAKNAIFMERREWNSSCIKCGSDDFSSYGCNMPPLRDHLSEWGNDLNLHFIEQDEDIILAEKSNVDELVKNLDDKTLLKEKRRDLLSALCVLLYDNLPDDDIDDEEIDEELQIQVKELLLKRLSYFNELEIDWYHSYINETVFPVLGIQIEST